MGDIYHMYICIYDTFLKGGRMLYYIPWKYHSYIVTRMENISILKYMFVNHN